jgi:tetratricopeptide (TPR) repeat protein
LWTSDQKLQDQTLRKIFGSKVEMNKALAPLFEYRFVKRFRSDRSLSIHRLVQDVMRDIIEERIKDKGTILECLAPREREPIYWIQRAIETLDIAYPPDDPANWKICETLNPHGSVCIEHARINSVATDELSSLKSSVGLYEYHHGNYDSASMLFHTALQIVSGVRHIKRADTINNLGKTYFRQGKYDDAIEQYQRALEITEQMSGVDHTNTAKMINNLGVAYNAQGRHELAIVQYERALRIYQEAFGMNDINTAETMNNLGLSIL